VATRLSAVPVPTVMNSCCVPDPPAWSVICRVKSYVPAAVGVPLIRDSSAPSAESCSPGGRLPLASVMANGPLSAAETVMSAAYRTPTSPGPGEQTPLLLQAK
jgi:hypothetical protein